MSGPSLPMRFEETGLVLMDATAPAHVWTQEHRLAEMEPHGYAGVIANFFAIPLNAFTRESGSPADAHDHPYEEDMRWWSHEDVESAHREGVLFSPRAFPRLMRDLLDPKRFAALQGAPLSVGL